MTAGNRLDNIRLEWQRAEVCRRVVRSLSRDQFWADAVSRAYYGMFHLGQAVLLTEGLQVKTHEGLVHLLSLHFVRQGELAPDLVRRLSQMQRAREDADYSATMVFDREAAAEAESHLEAWFTAVEALLRRRGFEPR